MRGKGLKNSERKSALEMKNKNMQKEIRTTNENIKKTRKSWFNFPRIERYQIRRNKEKKCAQKVSRLLTVIFKDLGTIFVEKFIKSQELI